MNFKQRISAHAIGVLSGKDLIETAHTGLREGYKSLSLQALAESRASIYPLQLEDFYQKALKELKLVQPGIRTAVLKVIKYYNTRILKGELDPQVGFELINLLMNRVELGLDDFELDEAFVLYNQIQFVLSPNFEPDDAEGLSRTAALEKYKNDLVDVLQQWMEKCKDKKQALVLLKGEEGAMEYLT